MKRFLKIFLLVFCAMSFLCFFYSYLSSIQNDVADVVLDNIEALASNESEISYACVGAGAIDCKEQKVLYIINLR